jgi:hypothetical protein
VRKLEQGKKHGKPVNPAVPEPWAIGDAGRNVPSLRWFLTRISPLFPGATKDDDPVFRQVSGEPWTEATLRQFIAEGMLWVLRSFYQDESPGPHSLRRAGATWRYRHGWTLKAIAALLGDTEDVADGYIDHAWVVSDGGPDNTRSRTQTPPVPMIRSDGGKSRHRPKGDRWRLPRGPGSWSRRDAAGAPPAQTTTTAPPKGESGEQTEEGDEPSPPSFDPISQPWLWGAPALGVA